MRNNLLNFLKFCIYCVNAFILSKFFVFFTEICLKTHKCTMNSVIHVREEMARMCVAIYSNDEISIAQVTQCHSRRFCVLFTNRAFFWGLTVSTFAKWRYIFWNFQIFNFVTFNTICMLVNTKTFIYILKFISTLKINPLNFHFICAGWMYYLFMPKKKK